MRRLGGLVQLGCAVWLVLVTGVVALAVWFVRRALAWRRTIG